jgi:hypothetical protein
VIGFHGLRVREINLGLRELYGFVRKKF